MRFSKNELRKIIFEEMVQYLEEGRQEKNWIAKQPEEERDEWESAEQKGLKLSDLAWIRNVRGGEPIQDIVGDVIDFRDEKTQKTLKSNNFETNLSKKTYPTVNDLRRTLQKISDANKLDVQYDDDLKDPSQVELLGKVGNWEILMPLTQRGSIACDISGGDTTWCTTKTQGQNLFYSYVARQNEDIILFYVMDYSRTPNLEGRDADARLSIGFLNGEPVLEGESGGLSVDAENNGLTKKELQNYLGDNYDKIMSILKSKSEKVGSKHPAKETFGKAAQNVILLKKLVKDYGKEEKIDFFKQIIPLDTSIPVNDYLYTQIGNDLVSLELRTKMRFARKYFSPETVVDFLSDHKEFHLENNIAYFYDFLSANIAKIPESEIVDMYDKHRYRNRRLLRILFRSPNIPMEIIELHAEDELNDSDLLIVIAQNPKINDSIIESLVWKVVNMDDNYGLASTLLRRLGERLTLEQTKMILEVIYYASDLKHYMAKTTKFSEIIDILSADSDPQIVNAAQNNPNRKREIISSNKIDFILGKDPNLLRSEYVLDNFLYDVEGLEYIIKNAEDREIISWAKKELDKLKNSNLQESKFKISKNRLRQIILEEVLKTLNK